MKNKSDVVLTLTKKLDEYNKIKKKEDFLISNELDSHNKVERILLESDILSIYLDAEKMIDILSKRSNEIEQYPDWKKNHIIDKIYFLFIQGLENDIVKREFLRLQHEKARNFYKIFTENLHRFGLKEHILYIIKYFISIRSLPQGREFYIGDSYGEFGKLYLDGKIGKFVYLDLSSKSNKELANIALVKIKIESDFVSYTLNNFVNVMNELGVISEDEYNLYIYGTTNKSNSEFIKLGFSSSLINRLNRDKQIKNLSINTYGLVECNDDFINYINIQDDLIKFEVSKFIDF